MKEKTVTFDDGLEVTLREMTADKYYDMLSKYQDNQSFMSKYTILNSIVRWNLKDESGKDLPVTEANFNKFGVRRLKDLLWAALEVNGATEDEKKNLLEPSAGV